jgi:glycogen operon protein
VLPGRPLPLGATWDGGGTNFALVSEHAERVELCLFDEAGAEHRHELGARTDHVWHGYLPGVGPGQRYGYRVAGPYAPAAGHRFAPAKLLLDPYARAIAGGPRWEEARVFGYPPGDLDAATADPEDDAAAIPKCVVVDTAFDWEGDRQPERPWGETLVYELHVKGFTQRHPDVRPDLRGTYAGLASDAAIGYLQGLGVTAVELLPVHHIVDERFLHDRGLTNYWGYSSIGFFAPHAGYAATGCLGEQVAEFKGMVKALHRAGIEVILDVVYNHTAEGDEGGPTLGFRGLDNAVYYRLDPSDLRRYQNFAGTGNSLDASHPEVLRLIADSLRYFAAECHVDGFRFDLASSLARGPSGFDRHAAFLALVRADPVLARVKLIAEPWDLGPGGYQVGGYPAGWREWNDRYRDGIRDFWRGHAGAAVFASRFTGSSDLYGAAGRGPTASINFVTAHDGFTLADLVSYDRKHNEANGEDGADGTDDNRSWSCGAEGPTDDPGILALRARQQRNFLATLLLSLGVPMVLAGDERGRTQRGNNNAWCQDNEISWVAWDGGAPADELRDFVARVIALRAAEPVFRSTRYPDGRPAAGALPDAWWFRPDGRAMAQRDWQRGDLRQLGLFLNGREAGPPGPDGSPSGAGSFLLLLNAGAEPVAFRLPPRRFGLEWALELSTEEPWADAQLYRGRATVELGGRSLLLLRRTRPAERGRA